VLWLVLPLSDRAVAGGWDENPAVKLGERHRGCCLSCSARFLLQIAAGPCVEAELVVQLRSVLLPCSSD